MGTKEDKSLAQKLRESINIYFVECEKKGVFPDYAGMKLRLGIKKETDVQKMCEDPEVADVFEEAKYRRESFLVRRMTSEPKLAQGCLNALKQPINGGYNEKAADSNDKKLIIVLDGIGEDAYK